MSNLRSNQTNRILFAAGGTAGHIEPAWAVSEKWRKAHLGDELAFLGTASGLEVDLIPNRGGTLFLIPKVTAPRALNFISLLFPAKLFDSVLKTISIVKNYDLVVGFGGYVSASAYIAAAILRKPIVIHEQNAKVGIANKLGSKFAKEILVAYPNAAKDLPSAKVVGNPIKTEIINSAKAAESNWQESRLKAKAALNVTGPLVLILGGSSGSTYLNEVIKEANVQSIFKDCTVIHSLGKSNPLPDINNQIDIQSSYRPINYLDDMATALLASDLVISRSGAIATTEFAALGKYALFIPLPIGNGEQALNAKELVAAHKAELLTQNEFTSTWLSQNLDRLLKQGDMAAYGTNLNAAELIVASMERVLI